MKKLPQPADPQNSTDARRASPDYTPEAFNAAVNLLILSSNEQDVKEYLKTEHNQTPEQTTQLLKSAHQFISTAADYDDRYERGKTYLRYELLFQQSQQIQDIATSVKITIAQDNFLQKHPQTSENQKSAQQQDENTIRKYFEPLVNEPNLSTDELIRRVSLELINQRTKPMRNG